MGMCPKRSQESEVRDTIRRAMDDDRLQEINNRSKRLTLNELRWQADMIARRFDPYFDSQMNVRKGHGERAGTWSVFVYSKSPPLKFDGSSERIALTEMILSLEADLRCRIEEDTKVLESVK